MRETFPPDSPFITEDSRRERWAVPYHYTALNCRVENLIIKNSQAIQRKTILDLGCHFGTFAYAALVHGAVHVHGIDSENNLIIQAERLFNREGVPHERYHFSCSEINSFLESQPDDSFDTVLCLGVFYYLIDPVHALEQMKRVAKRYIIIDTFTAFFGACMSKEGESILQNMVDGTFELPMVLFPATQSEKKDYTLPRTIRKKNAGISLLALPTIAALEYFFTMLRLKYRRIGWDNYTQNRRSWRDYADIKVKKASHWADIYSSGIRVSYLVEK